MSHFFAYLAKMKYINRWGLMRNTEQENIQEHSLQVAMIAHALAVIRNKFYQGRLNPEQIAVIALYHEIGEVLVGDIPTPIKYFNQEINQQINKIEKVAREKLFSLLPDQLKDEFKKFVFPELCNPKYLEIVKAADKISAYLKCIQELKYGNKEFEKAARVIKKRLDDINLPEVRYFLAKFLNSFTLSIDELN